VATPQKQQGKLQEKCGTATEWKEKYELWGKVSGCGGHGE